MRFEKIKIGSDGVELKRSTRANSASERIETKGEDPAPSFIDALQAFRAYVTDLVPVLAREPSRLTVTTLNIGATKDGRRTLQVSVNYSVELANDAAISMTTPRISEAGESTSEDAYILTDAHLAMIKLAESEATKYVKGERSQVEMFSGAQPSENTAAVNERMAEAEVASTRKPRGKKKTTDFIPGVGTVVNPDATEPLTDDALRQLLLSVERDVPIDAIALWTSSERASAATWAQMRQREILNALKADEKMPSEPACVLSAANATLAEQWSDAKPPKPDAAAVENVKAAAGRTPLHLH